MTDCAPQERTVATIRGELEVVNAAIQRVVKGEGLKSLTVGSGEFQRRYSYSENVLSELTALRRALMKELQDARIASGENVCTEFRHGSLMYSSHSKGA